MMQIPIKWDASHPKRWISSRGIYSVYWIGIAKRQDKTGVLPRLGFHLYWDSPLFDSTRPMVRVTLSGDSPDLDSQAPLPRLAAINVLSLLPRWVTKDQINV